MICSILSKFHQSYLPLRHLTTYCTAESVNLPYAALSPMIIYVERRRWRKDHVLSVSKQCSEDHLDELRKAMQTSNRLAFYL
jgi:hypothetical protein